MSITVSTWEGFLHVFNFEVSFEKFNDLDLLLKFVFYSWFPVWV